MIYHVKTIYYSVVFVSLLMASYTLGFGQGCPTIEIATPSGMTNAGDTFSVRAVVKSVVAIGNLKYDWKVSGGSIIKGQGSDTIEVQTTKENAGENIVVTVTVSGFSSVCDNSAAETVVVAPRIRCGLPVDEFSTPSANEVKARVDNIFIQLNTSPNTFALFEIQFSESEKLQERKLRIKRILDAIKFRNYELSQAAFLIYKDENNTTTRVRILPLSTNMSDWINQGTLIYGQDMKQKLPTLFKTN